jgi:hypothetical protein
MSAAIRAAIAAAANTVTGIDVDPYFTTVTKPGAGCVRLDHTDYPNRLGGVDFWQVIVRLPQDLAEAEKFMDTIRLPLHDAIEAELSITLIGPQQVVFDFGAVPLPCLIVTGHRAQEE